MAADPSSSTGEETNISTFVFLDFESTSLLDRKCRITELCLLAVNEVDMKGSGSFPRVTNKLTLCLDPQRPISMFSSNITGLYNDSLENQKAFTEETVVLINAFLNHLSKPVCLLAHNGNRFDFPLLVSELKRINQSLDSLLLCADTLEAFRSLDGLPARYDPLANQSTGKKYENSPNKTDVTPAKSVTISTQSPLKRKGTNELNALNNHSPKVSRQDQSQDTKLLAEKVKKKLIFENIESNKEKKSEAMKTANVNNSSTENDKEVVEEFSQGLNDDDYLLALENVEKDLCKEKLVFGKSAKIPVTESISNDTKDCEKVDRDSASSSVNAPAGLKTSSEPCCVANGTGYFVRQNTNENVTAEADDSFGHINKADSGSAATVGEECMQVIPDACYAISKNENPLKNIKSSSGTEVKVSHSDTDFVVTLRPTQNSPIPDPAICNTSAKATEPVCNSSEPVPSTSGVCNLKSEALESSGNKAVINLPMISLSGAAASSEAPTVSSTSCKLSGLKLQPIESRDNGGTNLTKASKEGGLEHTDISVTCSVTSGNLQTGKTEPSNLGEQNVPKCSSSESKSFSATDIPNSSKSGSVTIASGLTPVSDDSVQTSAVLGSTPISSRNAASSSISKPASVSNVHNGSPNIQRQSYKLEEIYLRKFGMPPPQSHKAEDDCVTLMKIAKFSPRFIEWVNENAVLLSTVVLPF